MKIFIVLFGLFLSVNSFPSDCLKPGLLPREPAVACNLTECQLPECKCSSTDIPGGFTRPNTPQFVVFTFDDAVQTTNINYYKEAFDGKKNPNNCSVSATFFVSHEYNDYTLVHDLHTAGHEIALHSITHKSDVGYWKTASVELLTREFADQKVMMNRFAGVPPGDIKGMRMPFLQMAGNNQLEMMTNNGVEYDFSRETQQFMNPGLWPYTYKYSSIQECSVEPCATQSFPKVWSIPMISWENDMQNQTCAMADACTNHNNVPGNVFQWMRREFWRHYFGNRAPFVVALHSAWFNIDQDRFKEYKQFIDFIQQYKDVYIVSASHVIDWMKYPLTVAEMKNSLCHRTYIPNCTLKTCQLLNDDNLERFFTSCSQTCPTKYPWLGNPLGN